MVREDDESLSSPRKREIGVESRNAEEKLSPPETCTSPWKLSTS